MSEQNFEIVKLVIDALKDKKVEDLAVLDVRKLVAFTDYMVIGTGNSSTHVQTLANAVLELMKKPNEHNLQPEADIGNTWVLYDGEHFIVNLFQQEARERYNLENLWQDAEKIEI